MGGTHVHLGTHVSELDAAVAFDKAALCIRGDKAKINFPLSNYRDQQGNLVLDQTILLKLQVRGGREAGHAWDFDPCMMSPHIRVHACSAMP